MIDKPFAELVQSLAAKVPTPGGGAAAAMCACIGNSLVLMAVRFSRGKKANLEYEDRLAEVESQLGQLGDRLLPLAERDCASFDHVSRAYGLPKDTAEQVDVRTRAIEEAMRGAMVVPEELLYLVRDVLRAASGVLNFVSKSVVSDFGSGAEILAAAAESAHLNIRINASYLKDRAKALEALQQNDVVLSDVRESHKKVRARVNDQLV